MAKRVVWLKKWSGKHKKHLEKPMTVYILILIVAVAYVSIANLGKITGYAVTAGGSMDSYNPPSEEELVAGDCGAPCVMEGGSIGATAMDSQCIPVSKYYDERRCCVDYDCAEGQKCVSGVCG